MEQTNTDEFMPTYLYEHIRISLRYNLALQLGSQYGATYHNSDFGHTHFYASALLKIDHFCIHSQRNPKINPLGFEVELRLNCVSRNLRQNLFLFVANEESSRSPQGLRTVTALGLGSEGPRLNICFTWFYNFYTPITQRPPTVQCS